MGIANFETETKFEMLMLIDERKEYENWLDYVERESWADRMIEEERQMAMEDEARRLLDPNTVILTEEELRNYFDQIEMRGEKI